MILASSSPRRKEILEMFGLKFKTISPNIDEDAIRSKYNLMDKAQRDACLMELARKKAEAIDTGDVIIASDTMVFSNRPMGKPTDNEDAKRMLIELAGKTHEVVTGVAILNKNQNINFVEVSRVKFIPLDDNYLKFVDHYVDTGCAAGKAGAYGIQDMGAYFIEGIEGDYYNVMGLPIKALRNIICD